MTRKSKPRTSAQARAARARVAVTPRNVVLAGLGAAVLGRRNATGALEDLVDAAGDLQARGAALVQAAGTRTASLARRAKATLAPLRRRAEAFARDAEREFEATVSPVLVRFGLAEAPRRAARRPAHAAGRTARKPAARKAARRA